MPEPSLEWDTDYKLSPSHDLAVVDGDIYARQRILRRLFTVVGGYVFHQDYGAGLPQKIGRPMTTQFLESIVRSQIALENSVAPNPAPTISVVQQPGGLFIISIGYTSAGNSQQLSLTIAV